MHVVCMTFKFVERLEIVNVIFLNVKPTLYKYGLNYDIRGIMHAQEHFKVVWAHNSKFWTQKVTKV